jgi:hypothetical protein
MVSTKNIARTILEILGTPDDNCYVASEAYYHLKGGKAAGLKPVNGKVDGISHWWLVDSVGCVIDITAEQFDAPVDYSAGRGRGFLTKKPSKRAQELINRVSDERN